MGILSVLTKSWKRAAPTEALKKVFEVGYEMGIFQEKPNELAVLLIDYLYDGIQPEFLNKQIHPIPPEKELIAIGALMAQLHQMEKNHPYYAPFMGCISVLLKALFTSHEIRHLSVYELNLADAAIDFLKSAIEQTGHLQEDTEVNQQIDEYKLRISEVLAPLTA